MRVARAALHFWEEPPISGKSGSGTIFFSGCPLQCIFCQNYKISKEGFGIDITPKRLAEIMLSLQEQKANNINLVTPMHYAAEIRQSLDMIKGKLNIPVLVNSGGYEKVEELKKMAGYVNIYLPDYKFTTSQISKKFSKVSDYPQVALLAIREMLSQVGPPVFDKNGLMKSGVIVRHLLIPGELTNSLRAVNDLWENFGNDIQLSLMSQFTPTKYYPKGKVIFSHYKALIDFAENLGFDTIYTQELSSAGEEFIPSFNGEGVI